MNSVFNLLPWRFRNNFIKWHFERNGANLEALPIIIGLMPQLENEGNLHIAANVSFRAVRLRHRIRVWKTASLNIGENVFLNDGINICATLNISIGDHAKIGDQTYIYDSDFHQVSPDAPVRQAQVSIGNNVWIGANSMVLAGASIGDNSVVAAGSVVTGSILANCLAAGSPAKVIRTLTIPEGWVRP